jgi:hyperosmotically inducible protein
MSEARDGIAKKSSGEGGRNQGSLRSGLRLEHQVRRMTMRNKLPMLALAMVLGAGMVWAGPPTVDTQTMDGIQLRLDHSKVSQHGNVQVTYDRGVATLTGTVDSLAAKQDAEKAVRKAPGVTQVVDNIQVRAEGMDDQQVARQAYHEVLMYYAYGLFDYVVPEVHNGTLTVNGYVTQPFMKVDLGRILSRVKGVTALQNNLEVLPNSQFDDRLRLQLARAIYGNPYFTPYRSMAQAPIRIIVKNQNVILEGVVNSTMDRNLAGIVANRTGLSFSVTNNLQVVKG